MDEILKKNKNSLYLCVLFLACVAIVFVLEPMKSVMVATVSNNISNSNGITIAIDPGHGGRDPGKVGITGLREKDINLSIALKLQERLEKQGFTVIMTRTEDVGLYLDSDDNKKGADLRRRTEVVNNSNALVAISIHQNSFTQESIKGSQVFYYTGSTEGERLAKILQDSFKTTLQDNNRREAKFNDSYYMLKKTTIPIVIAECGYLSNYEESRLLMDEEYQEKLAVALEQGLLTYIESQTKSTFSVAVR